MEEKEIHQFKEAQELIKIYSDNFNWRKIPNSDKFEQLHRELNQLEENLKYKTDEEKKEYIETHQSHFDQGIGNLLFAFIRLANQLNVNVEHAFNKSKDNILSKFKEKQKIEEKIEASSPSSNFTPKEDKVKIYY